MRTKTIILLFLITVIALALRLWSLGNVPPSPDWDEAALGYNAYSIMQTGRDEYGQLLPIVLRSFDDYKPALYTYLIIPFIKIFDLSIVSVRLPSAILGLLSVVAVFFLVKEIFKKDNIALLVSFLMAISPWHIQFSRIAFESNIGLFLNIFFVLLFLKSFKKHWLIIFSSLLAGINIYTYQSEKVFTPLLVLALILIFKKRFISIPKKYIIAAFIAGLIIVLPMVSYTLTNKNALERARGVSIFNSDTTNLSESSKKILIDTKNNDLIGLFFDNRRFQFAKSVIFGYISHFDINWLFITGDEARHHAPGMGLMYLWEMPFLLIGLYIFLFGEVDKKTKLLIFSWFLIAPLPASVTGGVPHAVRTLNFLPTFQIFTAFGIFAFFNVFKKLKLNKFIFIVLITIIVVNFIYYLDQYFVQQNYYNSQEWQYGYKETIEEVKKIEHKYEKIVVSNKPYLNQSYIFFLFYLKYPPSDYQEEIQSSSGGFRENHKYGKFEFRPIEWDKELKKSKQLYVGMPSDFSADAKIIKQINFLDGKSAFVLVE